MRGWLFFAIGLVGWVATACGSSPEGGKEAELEPEVGFVDLPAETTTVDGTALKSSPARVFYALRPARVDVENAPLIVMHAGGPSGSVLFVLAHGTGARVLGPSGELEDNGAVLANAHLLYLDARQSGFSYGELDDPSDYWAREAEFSAGSFNPYQDAADLLQALFAVFDAHPALAQRDVFLMGESYGGLRNNVMLNLLLFASEYGAKTRRFVAPTLSRVLRERFRQVLGTETPTPDAVASWFRGQISLEPWFAGVRQKAITGALLEQPGSPLDAIAAETGIPYVRCGDQAGCDQYDNSRQYLTLVDRSAYDFRAPASWFTDHVARVAAVATQRDSLAAMLDVPPRTLDALFDRDRSHAYRFADVGRRLTQPQGDLEAHWGSLSAWDAYFTTVNEDAFAAFLSLQAQSLAVDPDQPAWGELFIENLRYVPALVTRAEDDLVTYGPAFAPTLASYPDVASVTEADSGQELDVEYSDGSTATIRAPQYANCSHSVLQDRPTALIADVNRFITDTR